MLLRIQEYEFNIQYRPVTKIPIPDCLSRQKDCYPLHLRRDCKDALEGYQYCTTLDMASGYYQLEVAEEDRDKTAFVTKYGMFSF